jgi:hypothetical protein
MANNKRIFDLFDQLTAEAKNMDTTGLYRLLSKKVFEYSVPRPGTVASEILRAEGSPGLVAVACHDTQCPAFGAFIRAPVGCILKITQVQRFGDTRIQLIRSTTVEMVEEGYFPLPYPRSLLEVSDLPSSEPVFVGPVRVTSAGLSKSLAFFPGCGIRRARWAGKSESCRFCSSLEADVQFLGVLTLLDVEGSSLRAF